MLVVDIGNSRIKWARVGDNTTLSERGSMANPADPQGLHTHLDACWESLEPETEVVVGSVHHPDTERAIETWVRNRWNGSVRFLRSPARGWGVVSAYREPSTLGVDRWAALVASRRRFEGETLIVDCGTAVTVDALAADGVHRGGMIIPGIELMKRSLLQGTSKIVESADEGTIGFASHTADALHSGAVLAVVGLIEKVAHSLLVSRSKTVLTGGDASLIHSSLKLTAELHQDLVLEGLATMAGNDP